MKRRGSWLVWPPGADLDGLAGMTAGLVGADLANLVNEAALLAVRRGKDEVATAELDEALERVIAGLEKKSRVLSRAERERIAHHEVGHALVSMAVQGPQTVRKISIIPRGISALGYTLQSATEDRFLLTRHELEDRIAVALGGRVAEEMIFCEVLTGAQDDLTKATSFATSMVRSFGMSRLGCVSFDREPRPLMEVTPTRELSEATAREIDDEASRIVDEQHGRVMALLHDRLPLIRRAARQLLEHETLTGAELKALSDTQKEMDHGKDDPRQAA